MKDRVEHEPNTLTCILPDISSNNYVWTTLTRSSTLKTPDVSAGELTRARSKSNTALPHPENGHRERGLDISNGRLYAGTNISDTKAPLIRTEQHQHNHKYHESRNKDNFHKSNEKFALNWAKVRADNGSIFVRKTNSPMNQQSKSNGKDEVNANQRRVSPNEPQTTDSRIKDRKENGRLPLTNMWTEVKRKRKLLRKRALKESKRNHEAKQEDSELDDRKPFVNDIAKVTKLYTNMTITAAQFRTSSLSNSDTGSSVVTLNRREAEIYRNMTKAYDDSTERQKRQQIFYKRLGKIQDRTASQKRVEMARIERDRETALKRQGKQLKLVRERFNADRMRRFSHQYVSHKVIDSDISDRHVYGLPEEYGETRSPDFKQRQKQTKEKPSRTEQKRKNVRTFGYLFPSKTKPLQRRPKMEGIDTLVISDVNENGEGTVARERDVKSVIKEATDYLHRDQLFSDDEVINGDQLDGLSDLDEDELFERARRKYQIDLDSDDEDSIKDSRLL